MSFTIKQSFNGHELARLLYWLSLLLLIGGMWLLVDPSNRKAGERLHLYITLVAFEAYIWMLIGLAWWQLRKRLLTDVARSGIFAVGLSGVMFIGLNELHLASTVEANVISVLVIGLTVFQLVVSKRWLGFPLPTPILLFTGLWILALATPVPTLQRFTERADLLAAGYLSCWMVAVLLTAHIPLVRWQRRVGWHRDADSLDQWWVPYLIIAILAVVTVVQLYSSLWSLDIEWTNWYFSPIYLAAGALVLGLCHACGQRMSMAWCFMCVTLTYAAVTWQGDLPAEFPITLLIGTLAGSPVNVNGAFASLLFISLTALLQWGSMYWLATMFPLIAAAVKSIELPVKMTKGNAVLVLMGSFLTLGVGALLQWWQERHDSRSQFLELLNPQKAGVKPDTGCVIRI